MRNYQHMQLCGENIVQYASREKIRCILKDVQNKDFLPLSEDAFVRDLKFIYVQL